MVLTEHSEPALARSGKDRADRFGAFVSRDERSDPAHGGPLHGMRFALKDLVDTAGRRPSLGLVASSVPPPRSDAPVLGLLLAGGARLCGFTTMTPLAYEPSGGNPVQGRPRNPWGAHRICGGSSSGSAVAVAARMVDFALGSDTGGSLRIPAQCCGVAAWKPSHGLVPVAGTMPLAPSLDTLGFLAVDCALLLRVAGLFDGAAATRLLSIGLARDVASGCMPDIAAGFERAASALAALGQICRDVALLPLIAACDTPVLTVMQAEAAQAHRARIEAGGLDPVLAARLRKGLAIDAATLFAGQRDLHRLADQDWPGLLGRADAVLLPVMRICTPEVAVCEPASQRFSARTLYELSALTRWVNGLGLPAVAIPVGLDCNGMPVAVQLVGRRGSDLGLLALACALQERSQESLLKESLGPMPPPPGVGR